ncbi:sigma factor-like helix-turn-helix DNA-binding protein [Paenibacillus sp. P32E]|uniref:sigma factor-like helix-turn-helix DNA-binding protein n=1 Tax=Paenibacillus sp. P32E TaxID=1349434 RepID=UPI00095F3362|nr:sigma factor-like helix-turn-helix DNA-binding protein [Paenibacillus sp. P32E]OKP91311.1 RNA polymerase subunit sigma-24 [Paenibacillus sp. P32E]
MNVVESKFVGRYMDLGPATAGNYHNSRNIAERAYRKADADDKKVISGMVSDCEYVEEWLTTGRRPGNKRGIERRAGYEREVLLDPVRMQAFASDSKAGSPANLTDDQRFQLQYALDQLSERERECYVLAHGECFSHSTIASMLEIAPGSVSEYIQRAHKKVSNAVENSLFFF